MNLNKTKLNMIIRGNFSKNICVDLIKDSGLDVVLKIFYQH